ncbi:MAG TPA: antibiotic biosynthesis monooxygenase [bacterium]|nr:antibiotic biosynthesis monooxygenase [bacterium]
MHIRTALIDVRKERRDECRRLYRDEILPAMREYTGNLFAHCMEPIEPGAPWLVMGGWVDRGASDKYGASAIRNKFASLVKPMLERDAIYRQYQAIE